MILGMCSSVGVVRLRSQLLTVVLSTLSSAAKALAVVLAIGSGNLPFRGEESEQITRTVAELTITYLIPVPYASA